MAKDRKTSDPDRSRRDKLSRAVHIPLVERASFGSRIPKDLMFQIQDVATALGRYCDETKSDDYRVVIAALAAGLPEPTDSAAMERFINIYAAAMNRYARGAEPI